MNFTRNVAEKIVNTEDGLGIYSEQELDKQFYDELQEAKDNFRMNLDGYTQVASIPEALVNKWIREGFDFWNAPARDIIRKLQLEGYTDFLVSNKTF